MKFWKRLFDKTEPMIRMKRVGKDNGTIEQKILFSLGYCWEDTSTEVTVFRNNEVIGFFVDPNRKVFSVVTNQYVWDNPPTYMEVEEYIYEQ